MLPVAPAPAPRSSSALGWGAYLACSWTWCIGMFLPVLLVRDYGILGFVAFAVPNILGAASVGWVITREWQAEAILKSHARAVGWFSLITRSFQLFFLLWLSLSASGTFAQRAGIVGAMLVLCFGAAAVAVLTRRKTAAATGLWFVSAGIAAALWFRGSLSTAWFGIERLLPTTSPQELLWLAPVCAFGFLLCPYLDGTFLSVRALSSADRARAAFTFGFCVLFPVMILFTLAYAGWMLPIDALGTLAAAGSISAILVLAHIAMQLGFTFGLHTQVGVFPLYRVPQSWSRLATIAATAGGVIGGTATLTYAGLSVGEVAYRMFMAFYGLVFPAYVWICVIPTPDGHTGPSGPKIRIWALAVGVAAPMFWMGFIERQTWWLAPGLGIVLLARLAVRHGLKKPVSAAADPSIA